MDSTASPSHYKRNPVFSVLVDGPLDLDRADLGYPQHKGLWELLLADKRPVEQRGLYCPTCYRRHPGRIEWMYVYSKRGLRIAVHHNTDQRDHGDGESDQHKALKERFARAAELGGFRAELEVCAADGRRRTDVLVTGADGRKIGFEPQLSYATAPAVRKRDSIAREEGVTPVWHVLDPKAPLIDHVHWSRTDNLPPEAIRNDRDMLVRGGVRRLELDKCDHTNPLPCPVRRSGRCGNWHPRWEPCPRQVDDLVRDIAAGDYVPLTTRQSQRTLRFWTSRTDFDLFTDNGGEETPPESAPKNKRIRIPLQRDAECIRTRTESDCRSTPQPPRDSGEAIRPAVTITRDPVPPRTALVPPPRECPTIDVTWEQRLVAATEAGCEPWELGPCAGCGTPINRYGPHPAHACAPCRTRYGSR
ncbi:competence protein CoiA family protein [Kitasatospora sp. NPDC004240]